MVDLKLEAVDEAKDLYVAVRVGEVQKLSRLKGTRNYKFNVVTVGDRKFAKVDVFRHVGSTNIGIKNAAATNRIEEVSCRMRDQDPLKFKVHLAPESQEKRQEKIDKVVATETSSKILEAKTYLLEHNLEDRLSQAMQAVLRERPEDPGQFIADLLKETAGDYVKLAPKASSTPASDTPVWSHKPSIGTWLGFPNSPISKVAPSISMLELRKTAQAAMMKGAEDGSLQKILGVAPSSSVLELRKAAQAAMMKGAGDGSLQKILEAPCKSTGPQLSRTVPELRKEAHEAMLKGARDGSLQKVLEESLKAQKTSSFSQKPSVGTWLAPRRTQKTEETAERSLAMIPLQCLYGGTFASSGIRPNFVFR